MVDHRVLEATTSDTWRAEQVLSHAKGEMWVPQGEVELGEEDLVEAGGRSEENVSEGQNPVLAARMDGDRVLAEWLDTELRRESARAVNDWSGQGPVRPETV